MGLITYTPIEDGNEANMALFNSRFLAIHNVINGSIDANNLANDAVTGAKLATDSVTTGKIMDANVTTAKLAANAITAAKIEAQQAWVSMTLQSGWSDYDSNHSPATYMKDSLGFVHLRGLIKNGTVGSIITNMPVGYRSTKHMHWGSMSAGSFAVLRLDINGNLTSSNYSSTSYLTLDGITYKADA